MQSFTNIGEDSLKSGLPGGRHFLAIGEFFEKVFAGVIHFPHKFCCIEFGDLADAWVFLRLAGQEMNLINSSMDCW